MKSDHMGEKHLRLKMENLEIFENYILPTRNEHGGVVVKNFFVICAKTKQREIYFVSGFCPSLGEPHQNLKPTQNFGFQFMRNVQNLINKILLFMIA